MPITTRLLAVGVTGAVLAGLVTSPAAAAPGAAPADAARAGTDRTSAAEARRVDRVPTPKLDWYACYGHAECATVELPLDYDKPDGPTTEIAVLRVKARDQKKRIGSLFVNPGGPGGSGTAIAHAAPQFLSDPVLDRFDIVGVDPRGIAASANIACFRSVKDQTRAYAGLQVAFPYGTAEEKAYVASARAVGRACSTTGKPLSGSMSTAEVARDMDVLRRAVGDRKLTYLGFSYGSALGQYYANMFPDRVRAVAVDGVLSPVAWAGDRKNPTELDQRLRSADGAYKALHEILVRCDRAGEEKCVFAEGDPVANYEKIVRSLRKEPLLVRDEFGEFTVTYADFVGFTLGDLYGPDAADRVTSLADQVLTLIEQRDTPAAASAATAVAAEIRRQQQKRKFDFPYDNGLEAFLGVICTDAAHPKDAGSWPGTAAAADRRAPYFGRLWAWGTAPCASGTWTVRDEDAYTGPFNRRTAAPVLIVGNYWDPATNYAGAVESAALLPNSRLLSSDSWGHTAYGTSACATGAVDAYLLTGALPAEGTVCVGDVQPFADPRPGARTAGGKQLPPVPGPLLPGMR